MQEKETKGLRRMEKDKSVIRSVRSHHSNMLLRPSKNVNGSCHKHLVVNLPTFNHLLSFSDKGIELFAEYNFI